MLYTPPGTSFRGSAEPYHYESSASDASTSELESDNSKSDRGPSLYSSYLLQTGNNMDGSDCHHYIILFSVCMK